MSIGALQMSRGIIVHLFRADNGLDDSSIPEVLDMIRSGGPVVLLNRDSVFSDLHLSSAVMQAARSMIAGSGRARDPSIEVLRWVSGSHQVSRAIEMAGAGKRTRFLLAVCLPGKWPSGDDAHDLLPVLAHRWEGELPDGLSDPGNEPVFGGRVALNRLGLVDPGNIDDVEAEKLILEAVCFSSLK